MWGINIFYLDIEELPEAVKQLHAGQYLAPRGKIIYYGIKKYSKLKHIVV